MPRSATERPSETPEAAKEPAAKANGAAGEATSADWDARCANCEARLHGDYCHACGQKRPAPSDYSLAAFLRRGLATITHLDGRFYRTVRALFLKPGHLSREHFRGRRARYLGPLRVFLVFNVVFFLLSTMVIRINTFRTPLRYHVDADNFLHDAVASSLVQERLDAEDLAFEAFAKRFDRRAAVLSKTLIIGLVPGVALLLLALHAGRERRYVKHLVFALHFMAFLLIGTMAFAFAFFLVASSLIWLVGQFAESSTARSHLLGDDTFLSLAIGLFLGSYLAVALRRAYAQPWWLAAAKAAAGVFGFYFLLLTYRAVLFFVTFYSL